MYTNLNELCQQKSIEYNRLAAQAKELKSNAVVLGDYLQRKDDRGVDTDDIYSIALLEDKSEVKKKDIFILIERTSNVLQNTT
jgi:hypothetical protein